MSDKYKASVHYTTLGWVIHPLYPPQAKVNSPGKQPVLGAWQTRGPASDDELSSWFNDDDYNIGLVCGKGSGVVVIDYDHNLFWGGMVKDMGSLTLQSHRTDGRGHVYFKYTPSLVSQKHHLLGIEVLSDGSNVVLPPSRHASGDVYKWDDPDIRVAEIPPLLLERLNLLFQTEQNLVQQMSDTRPCFKKLWNGGSPEALHEADGRETMAAWALELKAKGAGLDEILMLARLVYKDKFSSKETIKEFKGWKGKPWRCRKIKERLSGVVNCEGCVPGAQGANEGIEAVILRDIRFLTIAETDEVYYYNDGIYHPLGDVVIKRRAQEMDDGISSHRVNEIINTIKRKTYTSINNINSATDSVVVQNGVLSLETLTLSEHSPDRLTTVKLPIRFDVNAACPHIDKFLSEVLNSKDIPAIEEFFGYCLLKDYPIQKALMLVGGGANGKSTLLRMLKAFLGSDALSSISLQELEGNHFAVANLFGKLANLYADLSHDALKGTGRIKMLTGGDPITAERKFGGFFSYVNYAKLIFSANQIPFTYDESDAFFRRWVILNFPNTFEMEKDDKGLIRRLTTPDELSGFLNKALAGLHRLLKAGSFSNQESTDVVRDQYVRMSDSVQAFIWDCIECAPECGIEKQTLYSVYRDYCKSGRTPVLSEKTFFKRFPMLIRVEDYRPSNKGVRFRAYAGVRFSEYILSLPVQIVQEVHEPIVCFFKHEFVYYKNREKKEKKERQKDIEKNSGLTGLDGLMSRSIFDQAVSLLHREYDHFQRPVSQEDMSRLRSSMEIYIQSAVVVDDGVDVDPSRFVDDYLKARGWI